MKQAENSDDYSDEPEVGEDGEIESVPTPSDTSSNNNIDDDTKVMAGSKPQIAE